jgi:hypothetical protein
MSTYQPNIPTGTVNLDQDYLNIQGNFQQLDTSFAVDHLPFSNQTAQNGYHKEVHLVPMSTPSPTVGYGQLFNATINDGINTDQTLYFLTGGGLLQQLTRNFVRSAAQTGYTFLPGGLILMWGLATGIPPDGNLAVVFPKIQGSIAFPTNCFNVQLTGLRNNNGGDGVFLSSGSVTIDGFTIRNGSGTINSAYWTAIGI